MATYKQRTPYSRFNGRHSPEQDSTESFSANTYIITSGSSHINPTDEILVDQEWTSVRHSTSARAKARQQLFLHQEQQRAQEWHFVLEQHQRPSLMTLGSTSTFVQDDISSDEFDDEISDTESHSVIVASSHDRKEVALRLRARTRASSLGQSSIVSYSDLPSESLEGLGESEDFSIWSQDEEDGQSYSTEIRSGNYTSISPSTISLSSTTSNNMIQQHSLAQSQMPFHDGSGNFTTTTTTRSGLLLSSLSHHGSDHESDHGGWESSSSTGSIFARNQIKDQKNWRSRRSRQYALSERSRHPISPSEFDSVVNNIALFQARLNQKSVTGVTEAYSNSVPQIVISTPHTRISRRPLRPSKLSTCSIYESEMEDIDAMVADLPSKQGWLETFGSALNAIRSYETGLSMEDSTLNNPIRALAQHYTSEDIPSPITISTAGSQAPSPLSSSSSATSMQPPTNGGKLSNMEKVNNSDTGNNAAATDMKKIKQQVSASSLEALQSLQMRHRASYQDVGQDNDVFRPSVSIVSHNNNNNMDPMQVQFTPTIMDRSAQGHDSLMLGTRASLDPQRMVDRQEQTSGYNSNLLTTMVSTLRRVRDHVTSNLLHLEFDEENAGNLSGLGLECSDLGSDWTTTTAGRSVSHLLVGNNYNHNHNHNILHDGNKEHRVFGNNTVVQMSKPNVRRASSDCGLESLLRGRRADPIY
ncbi:hypothetical protein BGZ80_011337 [Entomortierella chlamydospora]|uniref:Uncharacterized protein n=1 Tax=Entomortierella chlamydospora TaxID=101097 RepID=A0A9P6N2E9_9FUNG|nr:hypothetical protein BGZ79_001468 [Entomortierella chlamydospora]KAG0022731.1 hypothetical protein BGZ80_011337 [Entomortierella chlamydospora]